MSTGVLLILTFAIEGVIIVISVMISEFLERRRNEREELASRTQALQQENEQLAGRYHALREVIQTQLQSNNELMEAFRQLSEEAAQQDLESRRTEAEVNSTAHMFERY